ncbi:hypothetical protein [Tropicibacter oceani]|uniref:Uncharacterized protein n=1 Tax=Tropicibacter oceani TaxID=3058420 RepID=A0ABY8QE47_9RHOB|nr:hypothetical protein [Tropicibacter oceani]WGW02902.1 hypothetical protein QF118_13265 [Tropicibacter oceani]
MKADRRDAVDAGMGIFALVLAAGLSLRGLVGPLPQDAGLPVLVVAPPWGAGAAALVQQAGGQLVGPVQAPLGALAVFEGPVPRQRLLSLGAWMVRDGRFVATLCLDGKE